MIKKIARWYHIKFYFLILGPFFAIGVLIILSGFNQDHGHSHSKTTISREAAIINATKIITQLVKTQKLDASWGSVTASSVKQKAFSDYKKWEVVFVNENITYIPKKKIYIFLTLAGDPVAINYSGMRSHTPKQ